MTKFLVETFDAKEVYTSGDQAFSISRVAV